MKKMLIVLALSVLLVPTTSFAQTTGFVETWVSVGKDQSPSFSVDGAITQPLKKGWALETWALKCSIWGEVYVGVSKSLAPWASVIVQVGVEQADSPWRVAGSAWLGKGPISSFSVYETGGSGWWYKNVTSYRVSKPLAIGVYTQRFIGTSPYVEVGIGKVKIWAAPLALGTGQTKGVVGMKLGF